MERLISIGLALFLSFYAAQIFFIATVSFIETFKMNGVIQVFLILMLGSIQTILFFVGTLRLGDKILTKKTT